MVVVIAFLIFNILKNSSDSLQEFPADSSSEEAASLQNDNSESELNTESNPEKTIKPTDDQNNNNMENNLNFDKNEIKISMHPPLSDKASPNLPLNNDQISLILGGMLFVSFIVIMLLFYLLVRFYRWRVRIPESGKVMMLPEVHTEKLDNVEKVLYGFGKMINDYASQTSKSTSDNTDKIEEITNTFNILQKSLDNKDSEIKRLKEGYDNSIKKRYALAMLSLKDRIEYHFSQESNSDELKKACSSILMVIEIYLDDNDVVTFSFEEGESIRKIEGANVIKKVTTSDHQKIGSIIKTTKEGYLLEGLGDSKIIIREASVEAFVGE